MHHAPRTWISSRSRLALAVTGLVCAASAQSSYADVTYTASPFFGEGAALLGDVDGDGHAELLGADRAQMAVFSGRTLLRIHEKIGYVQHGRAGDIDGDGTPDFFAQQVSGVAAFEIIQGGSWAVLATIATPSTTFGLAGLGDVTGDGRDDFAVVDLGVVRVYSGATLMPVFGAPGDRAFSIGDVDGDGAAEFITQTSTRTAIYKVGNEVPLATMSPRSTVPQGSDYCAGVSDVDGDGVPDVAIGESYHGLAFRSREGMVWVASGATGAELHSYVGTAPNQRLGRGLSRLGDVNGDGVDEVLVGTTENRAIVMDLTTGAELASIDDLGHQFLTLSAGYDVTGDGVPDGVIGAPQPVSGDPGFLRVFSGATLTLQADRVHMDPAAGATVNFTIDFGPSQAGAGYLMLGSLSGISPGFSFTGVTLPLNPDFYLEFLALNPNSLITPSVGTLDAVGRATPVLSFPPGAVPSVLAGSIFDHACALVSGPILVDATNPMPLVIQ